MKPNKGRPIQDKHFIDSATKLRLKQSLEESIETPKPKIFSRTVDISRKPLLKPKFKVPLETSLGSQRLPPASKSSTFLSKRPSIDQSHFYKELFAERKLFFSNIKNQ